MNKQLLVLSALLLATTFSPSTSANEGSPDGMILLSGKPHINLGMDRDTVRGMLGEPSAQLSADVWVYFDFKVGKAVVSNLRSSGPAENQNTLIVGFKYDRANVIRACDSAPVRAFIAAQSKGKPSAAIVAAK
jgi:hypothetical protein